MVRLVSSELMWLVLEGSTFFLLDYIYNVQACKVQAFTPKPTSGWIMPDHETCIRARNDLLSFEKDLGKRDWNAYVRQLKRDQYLNLRQNQHLR